MNIGQVIWSAMLLALVLGAGGIFVGAMIAIVGWFGSQLGLIVLGLAIFKAGAVVFYYTYHWFATAA